MFPLLLNFIFYLHYNHKYHFSSGKNLLFSKRLFLFLERFQVCPPGMEITDFQTPGTTFNTTKYLPDILKIHWTSYPVILYIHPLAKV